MSLENGSRLVNRPYYDADTFDVGYSAVFRPDKGVVDPLGNTLTSKLSLYDKSAGGLVKNKALNEFLVQKTAPRTLNNQFSNASNAILNVNRWKHFLLHTVLKSYAKSLLVQPFDTCRILMQVGMVSELLVGSQGRTEELQEERRNVDEDIDFFPMYTATVPDTTVALPAVPVVSPKNNATPTGNCSTVLTVGKLDTWALFTSIKENPNFGWSRLWRGNNVSLVVKSLSQFLNRSLYQFVVPLYNLMYNSTLTNNKLMLLKIGCNMLTELAMLPFQFYKLKLVVSRTVQTPLLSFVSQYWHNNNLTSTKLMTIYSLMLLKLATHHSVENLLDFVIYYCGVNLTQWSTLHKFLLVFALKFSTDLAELALRLPLESLVRRFQLDYLLHTGQITREQLIVHPVDVSKRGQLYSGLWNGWKLGIMSQSCSLLMQIINSSRIDDGLALEKF